MSSYASVDHEARMRFLLWGWLVLTILAISGYVPALHLAGDYAGHAVLIRSWMIVYNSVILVLHGAVLALILYGGTGALQRAGNMLLFWCRRFAMLTFGVAFLAVIAMLAAPVVVGSGPFEPESSRLQIYTALVHLPSLCRTLGWGFLVVAMLQGCWADRSRLFPLVLLALIFADLVLVCWHWIATEIAVVAELHPFITRPLFLTPWACGSVIFIVLLRSEVVKRQSSPETGTFSGVVRNGENAVQRFESKQRLEEEGR